MSYESSNRDIDPQYGEPAGDPRVTDPTVADRSTAERPVVYEERTRPARTSLAAAFALAIAVAALVCSLVIVLGPLGLLLGIIGIVLSIFGIRNGGKLGITGRGMAIAALIISIVAALLGGAIVAGVSTVLTNQDMANRLENQLNQWKDRLPNQVDIPTQS